MTKAAALHNFFSSFGLTAFEESAVPTGENRPAYPYLTYNVKTDSFGDYPSAISCDLWYRSTTWTEINAKTEQISQAIGRGGCTVLCDGGAIWITRGSPFAQNVTGSGFADESRNDDMIRRKYININLQFITTN